MAAARGLFGWPAAAVKLWALAEAGGGDAVKSKLVMIAAATGCGALV